MRFLATTALCLVCLPLFSQTNQGAIQGAVLDQSGGAIAGAAVTVIDVARGTTRALTTDGAGQYVATNLNPGTYTVSAEAKGFRRIEHSGVLVEVGQEIRVDLVVQPGEQTQTVTVTGEVPAINSTDATLGGTVSNQSINALPLNGRNFERLLQLRPGVVAQVGAGTGTATTNGLRGTANMFRLEGIAGIAHTVGSSLLNNAYRGGDTSSLVPIDAIQEFSSEQNPKAEYGWKDGSVVNVGLRSGTNSIHGTAYAFGRDASATDAANFFTNSVTPATLEQFGATAGGPILKDKLFWFAAYEGLRSKVGQTATTTIPSDVAMPTAVDPTNNLSLVNACQALPGKINPLSAQLVGLNPATCVVTPASATVENIFPFNSCGSSTTCNTFAPGIDSNLPLNNGIFKGDYVLGTHHHLSGTFYESKSTQYAAGSAVVFSSGTIATQLAKQISGDWTWTPTSALVNDFRLGYIYVINNTIDPDQAIPSNPWPAGYGMNTGVTNPLYAGLPLITIGSFSPLGFLNGRPSHGGAQGDVNLVESVSYLRGKHAFKVGFEYLDMVFDLNVYPAAEGTVVFKTTQSFLQGMPNSGSIYLGNPLAINRSHWYSGFLQDDWRVTPRLTLNAGLRYEYYTPPIEIHNHIGTFDPNVNQATTPAVQQFGPGAPISQSYDPGLGYFSPRLGMAWDVRGNGKTVVRAAGAALRNGLFMGTMIPTAPYGANFPSIGVNNTGTDINAFTATRVALQLCATSVCPGQWNWNQTGTSIFPANTSFVSNGQTYTGVACAPAGFAVTSGQAPPPCQTGGIDPNFKQAYTAEWNLDIQQALTNNLTLDIAYVGNRGYQQEYLVDLNQPPIGTGWNTPWTAAQLTAAKLGAAGDAGLTSAQLCLGQGPSPFCSANTAAEIAASKYGTTFPYLSNIDIATTAGGGGFSRYNALQVTMQARGYHGLSFLAGYTFSHALAMTSGNSTNNGSALIPDKGNLSLTYGNIPTDQRQRFTFSPTYLIPGMKSPGQMLEGWSVNGILTLQSGLAWNPADLTTNDWLGTGENTNSGIGAGTTQFWNYSGPRSAFSNTGPTAIPCYGKTAGCLPFASAPAMQSACQAAAQAPYAGNAQNQALALVALTNNACYTQGGAYLTPPAYGTLGNATTGLFTGQHYYNVDFSVSKLWKFRERYSAQFRAEFFNLFNRADFAAPGLDPTKPSTFGFANATPDSANPVLGSGGPRHIQFGLKLAF
jgi:hypothetical protein